MLCPACESRLKSGEIAQSDIELARTLSVFKDKYPSLEKADFNKTHSVDDLVVVVVPKGSAGSFIGRRGTTIKDLSEHMKKKLKVVEETPDKKELVQRIVYPARLLGVNVLYNADKTESYKVRLSSMDKRRISDAESMKKLFSSLLGGEVSITFE